MTAERPDAAEREREDDAEFFHLDAFLESWGYPRPNDDPTWRAAVSGSRSIAQSGQSGRGRRRSSLDYSVPSLIRIGRLMDHVSVERQFATALDALIEQIKEDRSILAAMLCGSLSHDTVWAKSDIDLVLVTIDDRKVNEGGISLYADGVNIHAMLTPRSQFRRIAEGAIRNSFMHSFLAKGRLLYTHDETIAALCGRLHEIGERDTQIQLLRAGTHALGPIYKAHKWLLTRGDLEYSALWILYAATPLAQIEVIGRRLLADREVIPQALTLNPELFRAIYTDLLNERKTRAGIEAALRAA